MDAEEVGAGATDQDEHALSDEVQTFFAQVRHDSYLWPNVQF